ncbi:MAG TPA: YCF48-related protein [Bryobacteraceae bacterium]|nr:YCF48-related protein [Bryobacteraceae bacterium]
MLRSFYLPAVLAACGLTAAAEPHWEIQYRYRQVDSILTINDIAFPSATHGFACGLTTDRREADHPLVLVTIDGGKKWSEVPVKETGLSLFFLDESNGWMVTEKGIWQTVEGGRSWTRLPKGPGGMSQVWFLSKTHGFAAGTQKRVFETNDGGLSWTLLPILAEVPSDPEITEFGRISFSGQHGIISGWAVPKRRGGPDWMEPERAEQRREVPTYTVMLQTVDGGKTWKKSDASTFGQATHIALTAQGSGLGLMEFRDEFDYPSEVYRINAHSGDSQLAYRTKDRAITDVHLFDGSNTALLAGYETLGKIYHSPVPGKLKVLTSEDSENWTEMPVDYRAVAHRAMIAGPDPEHVWIATDTGLILNLVVQ